MLVFLHVFHYQFCWNLLKYVKIIVKCECLFKNIMYTRTSVEAATKGAYKKVFLKNFAIFTGKHSSTKCFPVNIAKLLRTFILKNIFQRLCGSKNQHNIGLKNWWIGQVLFNWIFCCNNPRFPDQGSNSFYF